MDTPFHYADDLGPAKVVHIHHPALDLKAIVVIDNIAAGPSIGGVRLAPDVSLEECFRLARAMTLKNAAAGLPHGGGKSVIFGDPAMPIANKERLIRAFAQAIRDLVDYIPGPDMGTNETCMAWIQDEIGRAVGLPPTIGGIPLDDIGATGYGVAVAGEVAQGFCDVSLDGARVAIQGFGSVGRHAARFLEEKGAVLVAASDSRGAIHAPDGLDVEALIQHKRAGRAVTEFSSGTVLDGEAVIAVDCDILVPAARPDAIRMDNVDSVKARLVLQGANVPVTADADIALHRRGVLSIPDFIANAGGVICAAVEYHGGTEATAFETIATKIATNTRIMLEEAARDATSPSEAAATLATRRVRDAAGYRRGHTE
ncbi:MAG: Glu/Leu/Phe/Val dehydrogenase [Alphaproteobacteria bacterium]|nr:Glu/Leu/Phe/Val dehydrogenase [Alphaproteobacteria bacterium]